MGLHAALLPYAWLLWDWSTGVACLKNRRVLAEREKWSAEEMKAFQWTQLKSLLNHAYQNVPFYRRRFEEAGLPPSAIRSPEDFARLPVLNRREVQDNLESMVASNYARSTLRANATGGSTGTPVRFYQDAVYEQWQRSMIQRSRGWLGFREGDRMAIIWGADRDIPTLSWFGRFRVHWLLRQRWLNAYHLTDEKMESFAHLLIRWRPRHILGYAAALYTFAAFLKERNLDRIRPNSIETSAEKLFDYQRKVIEEVFRCRVSDSYGSRETPNIAFECAEHTGLHVISDNVFLELLVGDRPAAAGEDGEVVVTPLTNYAMPLIRYRNGDVARWSERRCPCGRPFPLLEEVIGRSNDIIAAPDGHLVHGAFFNHLFFAVPGLKRFQVYQKSLNELFIRIQAASPLGDETLEPLRRKILQQMGPGVEVRFCMVDEIPPTPTGKYRYMMSEVGLQFLRNRP